MVEMEIQTTLMKRVAKFPRVCTKCKNEIFIGNAYHQEQGVNEHLHSLLARQFCSECYAKYGAHKLLSGNK
ncbi:MAG: hypothetical protein ACXAAH_16420 [Promethearchaeota archaeon]|jgi:hypothetical protein